VNSKTAELQESEKQFRAMFENNYAVMLMIDPETGSIILSNRAAVRYYGYSSEQFADMTIYQINQSAEEEIRAAIREAETEKYNCFHFPHRLANGEIRDVEVHSSPIPFKGKTILFSIVHDVTERRKAEKIIRKQAHLLDLIFEHSLDSIVLLDSEYNFIRVSETYARACQRDVSEFPGHNHFEFYPTELKNEFDEAAKEKKICQRFARPFVFEDHPEWGTTYWDLGLVPILDQEGKIELFLFTLKDVTESRRAEDALKKSEEHLRLITDNLPALVSHVDRNLNCLFANRAYRTYCSVNPEDLIGKKISEVLDKNGFDRVYPYLQKVLKGEFVSVENGLSGKDGRDTFFQVNYVPQIENSEVTGYFVLGWDITERKRAEAQIREYSERLEEMVLERTKSLEAAQAELLVKERLAVLGHFSGSVAHEIRNPLAVIDSAAYLLNMKLGSSDERIAEILKRITANVRKASGIIQSLLDLSRMKKPAAEPHNITDLIRESIEISRIPDTVKVVTNLPEDTVLLRADFQQIRMVLKNIINNAVQAMENEGKLTISAGQLKDGQIEIVIADIGPGIAPEYLEKVFEPLFSTKAHGIGFGLSITKMIIENHGGTIRAESEPGKGAAFTVILPFGGLA
jgi:PAS domain S-box-containing protein